MTDEAMVLAERSHGAMDEAWVKTFDETM